MSSGLGDPFHHVKDTQVIELPAFIASWFGGYPSLPTLNLLFFELPITKFMVLQVIAGLLTLWIFRGLAQQIAGGQPARGAWANFWEAIALYLRDEVVRPSLGGHDHDHDHEDVHGDGPHGKEPHGSVAHHGGHPVAVGGGVAAMAHPADAYLPFVWSCFFYILFCNLLGAVPFLGSPTGDISVTAALALVAFSMTFIAGVRELGFVGFWTNLIPPLDVPPPVKLALVPLLFVIEVFGLFIKHAVLAVRLFANIMGGHTVIGVMLAFIAAVSHSGIWFLVTPASIAGQIGVGLLELFVAFLQAYVFAFLATIFIGMGSHPH